MTKNTPSPNAVESSWIEIVAETWNDLRRDNKTPSTKEFSRSLAARLSLDAGVASGLLTGFQTLLAYAQGARAPGSTALEEERASVQAALAAVRPVLEARLQDRVNEVDTRLCGQPHNRLDVTYLIFITLQNPRGHYASNGNSSMSMSQLPTGK